jgi:hypothetical protein
MQQPCHREQHGDKRPGVAGDGGVLPPAQQRLDSGASGAPAVPSRGGGREPLRQGRQGEANQGVASRAEARGAVRAPQRHPRAEPPQGPVHPDGRPAARLARHLHRLRQEVLQRPAPPVGVGLQRWGATRKLNEADP